MIEDFAASFWDCQHCISMGQATEACTNRIRCRTCFRSGHVKKDCPGALNASPIWVPKVPSKKFGTRTTALSFCYGSVSPLPNKDRHLELDCPNLVTEE